MKKVVNCCLAGVLAVLISGLLTGTVSAGRLSLSHTTFTTAIPEMQFAGEEGGMRIRCPVTLGGSFASRTITKVVGTRIGRLTTARVSEAACTGEGTVAIEASSLPTDILYRSFSGTLPNITELTERSLPPRMINRYIFGSLVCTYAPGAGDNMDHRFTRDSNGNLVLTTWIWRIPGVVENNFFCPSVLTLEGTIGARSAEGARITLTLI